MEINIEHKKAIEDKCKPLFEKLNNIKLVENTYHFDYCLFSGLSNKFYHVKLVGENYTSLKVQDLCMKFFGAGSSLVDRDLELLVMNNLSERNYGPKVYETDKKTYRIEEFLHNCTTLKVNDKHDEKVNEELKTSFVFYNTTGDFDSYKRLVKMPKKEAFNYLLNEDTKQNIVNFTVKKVAGLGKKILPPFADKLRRHEVYSKNEEIMGKLDKIEEYLTSFEDIMFDCLPDKFLFNLAHNDSHFLNVLINGDFEKVLLIDHEYCCYNLAGVDIANYNVENIYYLGKESWPFYDFFYDKDYSVLNEEVYTSRFQSYVASYAETMREQYTDLEEFEEIVSYMKSKDYYWRCISFSVLLWFVWALNYLNFEEFDNKSNFDYFDFAYDRAQGYFFGKQFFNQD